MEEIWKDVIGFEGYYQVSSLGRVKSLDRIVKNRFGERPHKGKILSYNLDKDGYKTVCLSKKSKVKRKRVGRLVGESFLGLTNKHTIDHIDYNILNDNIDNLRILSKSKNCSNTRRNKLNLPIGVDKKGDRFQARGYKDGKRIYLGLFKTIEEAEQSYLNFSK